MASCHHHSNPLYNDPDAEQVAADCFNRLKDWNDAIMEIQSWHEYKPQPLRVLDELAKNVNISKLYYKDESMRFGRQFASFKALGAPYAVFRLLGDFVEAEKGVRPSADELRSGKYRSITQGITVCVATDGNQGRGLAYGAKTFGCRCVTYIHGHVSVGRKKAMEELDAIVIRVDGEYQVSVDRAKEDARMNGWYFISSTSWDNFSSEIPRRVMNGYMVLIEEACAMVPAVKDLTHILVCGGVGSIAAAIFLGFRRKLQQSRLISGSSLQQKEPRLIAVEPTEADCLLQSSLRGEATPSSGSLRTIMAGLACREPSPAAMNLLNWLVTDFVAVPDSIAVDGMRILASGSAGDIPIVCGESSGASTGLIMLIKEDSLLRHKLGIDETSQVLLFGLEGRLMKQSSRRSLDRQRIRFSKRRKSIWHDLARYKLAQLLVSFNTIGKLENTMSCKSSPLL